MMIFCKAATKSVYRLVVVFIALMSVSHYSVAGPMGDCAGTPAEAVVNLPSPLDEWGQIACTPYGHVLSNKQGWIWSQPGSYSPVFIPSQMVRKNPQKLSNKSYFTGIEMSRVDGDEFDKAYQAITKDLDTDNTRPQGYRLDVTSVSGKQLKLYFFDYGESIWGIWCREKCNPASRFMILNMNQRPE